jgi:hypothetical protein
MEVGQGPNVGCSANRKKETSFESNGLQKLVTSNGDIPDNSLYLIFGLNRRENCAAPIYYYYYYCYCYCNDLTTKLFYKYH